MYTLDTPLTDVLGFGQKTTECLANKQIKSIRDMLLTLPIRYEDRRQVLTIAELRNQAVNFNSDQLPTILATVTKVSTFYKSGRSIQRATVADQTGKLNLSWFNSPFIVQTLKEGKEYFFSGKYQDKYQTLAQPRVETAQTTFNLHTRRLVPIYSSTLGIKIGTLRRRLHHILGQLEHLPNDRDINWHQTFKQLHFPDQISEIQKAHQTLSLEELISLIKQAEKIKNLLQKRQARLSLPAGKLSLQATFNQLPFVLTHAQQQALKEILADLQKPHPANRLLQGDVGSGKTIVALLAAKAMIEAGGNVCLIAPTRVLASQHFTTAQEFLPSLAKKLILGGDKSPSNFAINQQHQRPQSCLYIGTQALLHHLDQISPGLVIFDEQHRFGVKQRSLTVPHLLTMTATPIPRSLMLSVFAYLDLSIIDELPQGRKPVKTWVVPNHKRSKALKWVKSQLQNTHGLALIVCPIIDTSDKQAMENVQAATDLYEQLKPYFEPTFKLGLLHGRMKKIDQEKVICQAVSGQIQALISTSVIEVGVDLPAASIMIIEAAERFGLASLHQLRGRIGRRDQQAYCLVFTNSHDESVLSRLSQFSQITNGQKLAELDLKNRGAGELLGLEQHGFGGLKYANWADISLIKVAQSVAATLPNNWQSTIIPASTQNSVSNLPLASC